MKNKNYTSAGIVFCLFSIFLFGCVFKKEDEFSDLGSKIMNEGELHLSEQQVQLGHILVDTVREYILGSELSLTGVLSVNQNNMSVVSSRVMGRIDKLYFKNTGSEIRVGEPIYDIYSEDINLALRELKLAIEKKNIQESTTIDINRMISSARNKLMLFGLSELQINELEKTEKINETITIKSSVNGIVSSIDIREGNYIMEGGSIMHVADYSSMWVEAQVFSEDMSKINRDMTALISFPDNSKIKVEGKVIFINPELNSLSKINLIRIDILNDKNLLKPGMQVDVVVLFDKFNEIALPTDAIILEEKGATVWLQTNHNTYENRMVQTGIESKGYTQILYGLEKGDVAVVSGNYLLQSEYTFKKGTSAMKEHKH